MRRLLLLVVSIYLISSSCIAQEKTKHQLGLNQGLVFLPSTIEENDGREEKVPLYINYIGLNYKNQISERWSFTGEGVVELARYIIEPETNELLKRENATVLTAMAGYEIGKDLELVAGTGVELERHRNLFVLRAGIEADLYVSNNWWVVPELMLEYKEIYYNISLGFKFMKGFGKKLEHEKH